MNYNVPQNIQFTTPSFRPPSSAGLATIPGYPGVGITIPFNPPPGTDLDPITPGIQNTPGIVTATGPSRVVTNGGNYGGQARGSFGSAESSGFMIGGNLSAVPRNHHMGIINGPLSLLENPGGMGMGMGNEGGVRVEPPGLIVEQTQVITTVPLTPPIQSPSPPPLPLQPTSQPFNLPNIPNETSIIPVNQNNILQVSSLQRQNNLIHKTPPCNIGWCAWGLISLAILTLILTTLFFVFRPKTSVFPPYTLNNLDPSSPLNYDTTNPLCENGQINSFGRCIKCPPGTLWNGTECVLANNFNRPTISNLSPYDFSSTIDTDNPNNKYKRVETINTSWNAGNNGGLYGNGDGSGVSGSTAKVINSVAEVKKIIVQPIVEDPIRHLRMRG